MGSVLALDAAIDRLAAEPGPGEGPDGLVGVARRLAVLPDELWDEVAPLYRPPRRRAHPLLSIAAAAVLVVVLVGAGLLLTRRGPTTQPTTARWRLAGFLHQAAWAHGGAAGGVGDALLVTCPGSSRCYAVQPGSAVVETSVDGGATWSASSVPAPVTSAVSCRAPGACAVAVAGPSVLFTTDGGKTWSGRPVPDVVSDLVCRSAVDCTAIGQGPATPATPGGPTVALRTTDGGARWTVAAVHPSFVPDIREGLSCTGAGHCVAAGVVPGSPSTGAIRYTADGGATWSPAMLPAGVQLVRAVACADARRCVAVGNGGAPATGPAAGTGTGAPYGPSEALTSTDGGRSWTLAGHVLSGGVTVGALSCPTAGHCWAAGHRQADGLVVATSDGGATWKAAGLPAGVEYVADISCPATGSCVAVGSGTTAARVHEGQVVLRGPG